MPVATQQKNHCIVNACYTLTEGDVSDSHMPLLVGYDMGRGTLCVHSRAVAWLAAVSLISSI